MTWRLELDVYNRRFGPCWQKANWGMDAVCYLSRSEVASDQGFHGHNSCPRGLSRDGHNGQKHRQKMRLPQGMWCCGLSTIWPGGSQNYIYRTYLSTYVHIYTRITRARARTCVREGSCEPAV